MVSNLLTCVCLCVWGGGVPVNIVPSGDSRTFQCNDFFSLSLFLSLEYLAAVRTKVGEVVSI